MMDVGILIEGQYEGMVSRNLLRGFAEKVIELVCPERQVELGLVITCDEQIRELNLKYRGLDQPTDVLSFALSCGENEAGGDAGASRFPLSPDGIEQLGEVIISCDQALRQADESGHPLQRELAILVIHGVLHLLGYDHENDEEAAVMEQKEALIVGQCGVSGA